MATPAADLRVCPVCRDDLPAGANPQREFCSRSCQALDYSRRVRAHLATAGKRRSDDGPGDRSLRLAEIRDVQAARVAGMAVVPFERLLDEVRRSLEDLDQELDLAARAWRRRHRDGQAGEAVRSMRDAAAAAATYSRVAAELATWMEQRPQSR